MIDVIFNNLGRFNVEVINKKYRKDEYVGSPIKGDVSANQLLEDIGDWILKNTDISYLSDALMASETIVSSCKNMGVKPITFFEAETNSDLKKVNEFCKWGLYLILEYINQNDLVSNDPYTSIAEYMKYSGKAVFNEYIKPNWVKDVEKWLKLK